jgi:hypothetical protein
MRAEARAPEPGIYAASAQDKLHDVVLFMRVYKVPVSPGPSMRDSFTSRREIIRCFRKAFTQLLFDRSFPYPDQARRIDDGAKCFVPAV